MVQVVVVLMEILVEQDQTILDQLVKVSLVAEVVDLNHLEVAAVAAVSTVGANGTSLPVMVGTFLPTSLELPPVTVVEEERKATPASPGTAGTGGTGGGGDGKYGGGNDGESGTYNTGGGGVLLVNKEDTPIQQDLLPAQFRRWIWHCCTKIST